MQLQAHVHNDTQTVQCLYVLRPGFTAALFMSVPLGSNQLIAQACWRLVQVVQERLIYNMISIDLELTILLSCSTLP